MLGEYCNILAGHGVDIIPGLLLMFCASHFSYLCSFLIHVMCVSLRIVVSSAYCVVCLFCFSSSCVPYVASFSGMSMFDCPFDILYRLFGVCKLCLYMYFPLFDTIALSCSIDIWPVITSQ
jgi:hypothetical protein